MKLYGIAAASIALCLIAAPLQASLAAESPTAVIRKFNDALLQTMQRAKDLGYKGRYNKLAPVIKSSFDLNFMARFSAGRYWRKLTDRQKDTLVGAFSDLTIGTYANRFDGYSGERFEILSEEKPRKGHILVKTVLQKSDGEKIKLYYLMRPVENDWRVIDIFTKGSISELSTKRSDYSATLKRKGYDGLIGILKEKIRKLGNQ